MSFLWLFTIRFEVERYVRISEDWNRAEIEICLWSYVSYYLEWCNFFSLICVFIFICVVVFFRIDLKCFIFCISLHRNFVCISDNSYEFFSMKCDTMGGTCESRN